MDNITDIDGKSPTEEEFSLIKDTFCQNCKGNFDEDADIMFVKTKTRLIWWHTRRRVGRFPNGRVAYAHCKNPKYWHETELSPV